MLSKNIFIVFFVAVLYCNVNAQRVKYNFNSGWKVFVGDDADASIINYNDYDWKQVTLPYAWNEDEAFKKDIRDLSTGIAWYRKHFKIPTSQKGRKFSWSLKGFGRQEIFI